MKCDNLPFLWKKIFLNLANNRNCEINYCNRPFNRFDQQFREWYLHILITSSNNLYELPEHAIFLE